MGTWWRSFWIETRGDASTGGRSLGGKKGKKKNNRKSSDSEGSIGPSWKNKAQIVTWIAWKRTGGRIASLGTKRALVLFRDVRNLALSNTTGVFMDWPRVPKGLKVDPDMMKKVLPVYVSLLWIFGYSVARQIPIATELVRLNAMYHRDLGQLLIEMEALLEKKAELDRLEEEPPIEPGIKLIWVPPPPEGGTTLSRFWQTIDRYLPGGYHRMVQRMIRESEAVAGPQDVRSGPKPKRKPVDVDKWTRTYSPGPRQYTGVGVWGCYVPKDWSIRDGEEKFPDWASGKDLEYVPTRKEVNEVVKGLDPGYGPPAHVYKWMRIYQFLECFPNAYLKQKNDQGRVVQEEEDFLLMLDLDNPRIQKLLSQKETMSDSPLRLDETTDQPRLSFEG